MIRFISGVFNAEIGTATLGVRQCIAAHPHATRRHPTSASTEKQRISSNILYRTLPMALLTLVLLAVNVNLSGCARSTESTYTKEATQRRMDKNNPPYTQYPHRGRSHFQSASPKKSGDA